MAGNTTLEEQVGTIKTGLFSLRQEIDFDVYTGCMRREAFFNYLKDFMESNNKSSWLFQISINVTENLFKSVGMLQLDLLYRDMFSILETDFGINYSTISGILNTQTIIMLCDEEISDEIIQDINNILKTDYPEFEDIVCKISGTIILAEDSLTTALARLEFANSQCKTSKGTNLCLITK